MKLFIVIYLFNAIAGSVGPLPYGIDECENRARASYEDANNKTRKFISENNQQYHNGRPINVGDLTFKCEYLEKHPNMN